MRNPFDATGTIGSRPCELSLNKILAEKNNPKLIKYIVRLLQKVKFQFEQLNYIPDEATKHHFKNLLKEHAEDKVSKITGSPVRGVLVTDLVASHACCCINAYYKD